MEPGGCVAYRNARPPSKEVIVPISLLTRKLHMKFFFVSSDLIETILL